MLKPGGHFLFGTPNKRRFLGYVGSARSLGDKVRYNWADWKKRFKGQWSNEAGAHAGFTERELSDLTREAFGSSKVLSDEYYRRLYKPALVQTLSSTGLKQVAYPCVYVGGQRL